MKKVILLFTLAATLTTVLHGQCPTQIQDQAGDGSAYNLTLTSMAQCPANGTIFTLNSVSYSVNDCGDLTGNGTPTLLQLVPSGGGQIVLATAAPVSFTFGMTTCTYNSSGQLIVLPIELLDFKGTTSVSGNLLTWTTANEVNNKGFEVERSADSKTFRSIGFVTGNGTTSERQNYSFEDKSASGLVYYRLKQLDFDGRFEYSKIIAIDRKGENVVSVFPNPSKGIFTITGIKDSEDETFTLINSIGQTLSINVQNKGQLDMSAFPSGVYYLRVASSGQMMKLVKE